MADEVFLVCMRMVVLRQVLLFLLMLLVLSLAAAGLLVACNIWKELLLVLSVVLLLSIRWWTL